MMQAYLAHIEAQMQPYQTVLRKVIGFQYLTLFSQFF